MGDVTTFKVTSMVAIATLAFVGGMLPSVVQNMNRTTASFLNVFAGGIFLAGSLVHLLPEAAENRALKRIGCSSEQEVNCGNYPFAFVFYGLGFLVILLIEMVARNAHKEWVQLGTSPHESDILMESFKQNSYSTHECHDNHESGHHPHPGGHHHSHGITGDMHFVSIIIFIALSFHSVMEGIGIGSQQEPAWGIFIAIIAHKGLAAFSLGVELYAHKITRDRFLLSIALFSMMTPLGIVLGWTITSLSANSIVAPICTAMAGGTFLFVAVMEIIPQELEDGKHQLGKCIVLSLGFCMFSILAKWV